MALNADKMAALRNRTRLASQASAREHRAARLELLASEIQGSEVQGTYTPEDLAALLSTRPALNATAMGDQNSEQQQA